MRNVRIEKGDSDETNDDAGGDDDGGVLRDGRAGRNIPARPGNGETRLAGDPRTNVPRDGDDEPS